MTAQVALPLLLTVSWPPFPPSMTAQVALPLLLTVSELTPLSPFDDSASGFTPLVDSEWVDPPFPLWWQRKWLYPSCWQWVSWPPFPPLMTAQVALPLLLTVSELTPLSPFDDSASGFTPLVDSEWVDPPFPLWWQRKWLYPSCWQWVSWLPFPSLTHLFRNYELSALFTAMSIPVIHKHVCVHCVCAYMCVFGFITFCVCVCVCVCMCTYCFVK